MRYYFGAEARLRRAVEDAVMSVFDGWSYEEIATPTVDYYALFERGMGHAEAHRAFRFTDTDGRMLALRPDVTSSVARAAATLFAERPRPLRFSYAASVFRQRPHSRAEWRRQSRQLGCELIGTGGGEADVEMLVMAVEVLEQLGLHGAYRITLNHVGIFAGVAEQLALDEAARERLRGGIDMRDASELRRFLAEHAPSSTTDALAGRLVRLAGKRETLEGARASMTGERSTEALDVLENLWGIIETLGLGDSFEIDLADVSGLDYYTGLVFKIYVAGAGARVGGGGRYDELTANFGRREPAVGFVLDLDMLTDLLARANDGKSNSASDSDPASGTSAPASVIQQHTIAANSFLEARRRRARGERIRMGAEGEKC